MSKISAVYCVHNGEDYLTQSLKSLDNFADEIIIIDLESTDKTVETAKKYGAKVFRHKNLGYVEPVRNFGISKAMGDWILILDPDEELPESLVHELKKYTSEVYFADYVRIPRKNIIFGKWMKHTGWWPDMNIRFFKKGSVSWNEIIHSVPMTTGKGLDLKDNKDLAIIHNNYDSLENYFVKMLRYSKIQSEELMRGGYKLKWTDLATKPMDEFLSRFFSWEGYKDGLHGLVLSLLQAFSILFVYIKIWEKEKFEEKEIRESEFAFVFNKPITDLKWWIRKKLSWLKFL